MRKGKWGIALVMVLLSAGLAWAGTVKEYSADMVDVNTGKVVQKLYVTEQKMRVEQVDAGGKPGGGSIVRLDKKMMYVLQENKTYMEFPLSGNAASMQEALENMRLMGMKPQITREKQGTETVNGYKAEKVKTTVTLNMGGQKTSVSHLEWQALEFEPMPVRTQNPRDNSLTEMRNIKTGAPSASLFEIPAGYKKDTSMEDMMKQMQQKRR